MPYTGSRPSFDMSQDFILWRHQVRRAVGNLCTLDTQQNAHKEEDTNNGFHAAMRTLYVESHFTEFLACQAWRQTGLDEAAGSALHLLQHQLDAYDEPDTDAAIIADPTWQSIQHQATIVVTLLSRPEATV